MSCMKPALKTTPTTILQHIAVKMPIVGGSLNVSHPNTCSSGNGIARRTSVANPMPPVMMFECNKNT